MNAADRHTRAVLQSIAWAREAAERGDFKDALAWLDAIEAIDGRLPVACEAERADWLARAHAAAEVPSG